VYFLKNANNCKLQNDFKKMFKKKILGKEMNNQEPWYFYRQSQYKMQFQM
jgi:hypothetical protein